MADSQDLFKKKTFKSQNSHKIFTLFQLQKKHSLYSLLFFKGQDFLDRQIALLSYCLDEESQKGTGFCAFVALVALSLVLYFSLPVEPSVYAFPVVLCVFLLLSKDWEKGIAYSMRFALIALLLGLSAGTVRTAYISAPILKAPLEKVGVRGWVSDIQRLESGQKRALIKVSSIQNLAADETPHYVRLRFAQKDIKLSLGAAIWVRADLRPPPDAIAPDLANFPLYFYYQKIGGLGFVLGKPRAAWGIDQAPLSLRPLLMIEAVRSNLENRIYQVMQPNYGALAAALIVGKRGAILKEDTEALRLSGLAHVLAISGLHMGLIAFTAFHLLRGGFALHERWVLEKPIKKYAAFGAFLIASVYLLISGMNVATIRAYVMTSLILLAIILGRNAVTMRGVALSALFILLIWPESLLAPGFQMSFAAVIALIAFYEQWQKYSFSKPDFYKKERSIHQTLLYFILGLALTSLIAGLATAPIALFHFHRLAPYSLVGNVLAMPLMTFIVMPFGLFSVLLMPFGLEAFSLSLMEYGLKIVMMIAHKTASLAGAEQWIVKPNATLIILSAFGFVWLSFCKTKLRLLGLLPLIGGLILSFNVSRPDLYIARDGKTVGIRHAESGLLEINGLRYGRYDAKQWMRADGDGRAVLKRNLSGQWQCERKTCVYMRRLNHQKELIIIHALQNYNFKRLCTRYKNATVLFVTPLDIHDESKKHLCENVTLIDKKSVDMHGAHSAYLTDILTLKKRYEKRIRPWESP